MSESLSMEWNRRLRGLIMFLFNFGVELLEQSVRLDQLVILISLEIPFFKHHFFQTDNQKAVLFTVFSLLELFSAGIFCCCGGQKRRPLFRSQIFGVAKCCDI